MRILCTFPGRAGDLLWALPTMRAIGETYGQPVDLLIAGEFASMCDLLHQQAYLGHVYHDPAWGMTPPNWQPPTDVTPLADVVYHVGYRDWPTQALPHYVYDQALKDHPHSLAPLDLDRPWITVDGPGIPLDIAVGFTEAWFELKLGLLTSLERQLVAGPTLIQLTPPGTRWTTEVPPGTVSVQACDWLDAARAIRNADLFFGDCSALHVLAVAMGQPVVLMEPMEARWDPIFYPLGKTGRVRLVTGHDGLPSFDARHCAEALQEALRLV